MIFHISIIEGKTGNRSAAHQASWLLHIYETLQFRFMEKYDMDNIL